MNNNNFKFFRNFDNLIREEEKKAVDFNKEINQILKAQKPNEKMSVINSTNPYEYQICGQGLIIGSNLINYSAIKLDNRSKNSREKENKFFQNTLNFDYTLGDVIIPGSGVKGALRSTLEMGLQEINEILEQLKITQEELTTILFENNDGNLNFVTYFDATIEGVNINDKVYLYSKENITPIDEKTMIANPLNFIKVVPTSKINFNIKVPDKIDEKLASRSEEILSILIANSEFGAKGNTGFGSVAKI